MTNKHYVYPYKAGLRGLGEICSLSNLKRIRRTNSKFRGRGAETIINWGCTANIPEFPEFKGKLINDPRAVSSVSNKHTYYNRLQEAVDGGADLQPVVHTQETHIVREWFEQGKTAFARTVLNGSSGEGIVDLPNVEALDNLISSGYPNNTVFAQYFPKKSEYRIHVANGQIIDVQRKGQPYNTPKDEQNWRVRNTKNNWVFVRGDGTRAPTQVNRAALAVMSEFGLDFGAVDILFNERKKLALCIEINTAPGVTNTTAYMYAQAFHNAGWLECSDDVLYEAQQRRDRWDEQFPTNDEGEQLTPAPDTPKSKVKRTFRYDTTEMPRAAPRPATPQWLAPDEREEF